MGLAGLWRRPEYSPRLFGMRLPLTDQDPCFVCPGRPAQAGSSLRDYWNAPGTWWPWKKPGVSGALPCHSRGYLAHGWESAGAVEHPETLAAPGRGNCQRSHPGHESTVKGDATALYLTGLLRNFDIPPDQACPQPACERRFGIYGADCLEQSNGGQAGN